MAELAGDDKGEFVGGFVAEFGDSENGKDDDGDDKDEAAVGPSAEEEKGKDEGPEGEIAVK